MKPRSAILMQWTLTLLSVSTVAGSAWLWRRSLQSTDLFYRLEPLGEKTVKRGFGSMKGVLVFGSIVEPFTMDADSNYHHEIWPVVQGGGSVFQARPEYKISGLGFGVSHGELAINLPLAFLLPKRLYHAVYVPYYFLMLLGAIQPARLAWKAWQGKRPRSSPAFANLVAVS